MQTYYDLLELIQSMSGPEKRYLRIHASRHVTGEKNHYMRVFEVMERQDTPDGAAFRNALRNEPFAGHLSRVQHYLYELILGSLRLYHGGKTVESRLRAMLDHIHILHEKGQHRKCGAMLARALKLARLYGKSLYLVELLEWERRLKRSAVDILGLETVLKKNRKDEQRALAEMENLSRYRNLSDTLFILDKKEGITRSTAVFKKFRHLLRGDIMKNEAMALSPEAKDLFYHIRSAYYTAHDDPKGALEWSLKRVRFMERSPHFITAEPQKYAAALNNYLVACRSAGKYGEMRESLKKMRTIPTLPGVGLTEDTRLLIFAFSYVFEQCYYYDNGRFEEGTHLTDKIDAGLREYAGQINRVNELILCYNCALLYFCTGRYGKALEWINRIIHGSGADLRLDIYCFAHVFNLIIHFELGHEDILESLVRSTYRILYKRNRLYRVETAVLNFIRLKLAHAPGKEELLRSFAGLQRELEKITKDPFERKALEMFDFIAWLRSKTGNKPFEAVLRERLRRVVSS